MNLLRLALSMLLAGCAGSQAPENGAASQSTADAELDGQPQPSGPLAQLSWLAGSWYAWDEEGGRCTVEQWMIPDGTSMIGGSRTVQDGRTVSWEHLRIEFEDDDIRYVAHPSNQAETTFRLTDSGETYAVFENPEHDFPIRIRYTLVENDLTVRIEGREADQSAEWTFRPAQTSPCTP